MSRKATKHWSTSLGALKVFSDAWRSIYTQVPPTTEMMDTIVQIMVEVLTILGIATKEMKQGRISE
jgi:hypothetical protein